MVDKINHIEIMRMQVEDLRKANAANKPVDTALEALNKRMYDTELNFLSRTEMHSDDKWCGNTSSHEFGRMLARSRRSSGDARASPIRTKSALNAYEEQLKLLGVGALRTSYGGCRQPTRPTPGRFRDYTNVPDRHFC